MGRPRLTDQQREQHRAERERQWRDRLMPSLRARWVSARSSPDPRPPTLENLAEECACTTRVLQRTLARAGLTFRALSWEARLDVLGGYWAVPLNGGAVDDAA